MSSNNYYKITLSYQVPYNVLDSQDPSVIKAKENLYERLGEIVPERYERFSVRLVLHQLKDTLNYLITYDAFFRSLDGLPMEEYCEAKVIKDQINKEFETFLGSIDCEFVLLNIKTFS